MGVPGRVGMDRSLAHEAMCNSDSSARVCAERLVGDNLDAGRGVALGRSCCKRCCCCWVVLPSLPTYGICTTTFMMIPDYSGLFCWRKKMQKREEKVVIWRRRVSIPVPLACKASALPFELHPHRCPRRVSDKCTT
ncbi:hypothetical protein KC19_5G111600 [Ceratodon purpureus]|uniref:Uncharacterized protein n=1 Tax=Ceratodon purpureus TaxID=3225 RepID=A0A8T0I1E3_CERPU|nr:hypothetical protein KC19_5G111600 [Ceratodon purpureus]